MASIERETADNAQQLQHLLATATQQYALKNYSQAAEAYSEAAELQDQINGEMSLENADLLYQYGRCLYHVAVSNSDVLGGKVAGSAEEPKRKKRKVDAGEGRSGKTLAKVEEVENEAVANGAETAEAKNGEASVVQAHGAASSSNPFFQITGDENWTDSEDEEGDEQAADGEAEEEEDDFAIAFEILDTARILLGRKLQALQEGGGKGESSADEPDIRQLKERLADTHDLQAEISLENERFADAISDTRDSLALKLELYPQESSLIAEAHFKLSLALEFASVTSTNETEDGEKSVAQVDENMRKEAAAEMEKAIASCKLRISKEEAALSAVTDEAKIEDRSRSITDVKEMVADMEQRLVDLRNPAVSLSGAGAADAEDVMGGVLGAMLGQSKEGWEKKLKEVTEGANDLTGLVKKGKGKRKVEFAEEGDGKRAKTEEP